MAYDLELAERVRSALADEADVRETKMFGGLAFMVNEKMVASVRNNLLVRVSNERAAEYLTHAGANRAEMKGRVMGDGWIAVDAAVLGEDESLQFWIDAVLEYNAASA